MFDVPNVNDVTVAVDHEWVKPVGAYPGTMNPTPSSGWLTLDEVAQRLGITHRELHSLMRDNRLAALRRDGDGPWLVPEGFLQQHEDGWLVLPSLRGTLIQLLDGGFSTPEAVTWLLSPEPSLRTTPLAALLERRIHEVRRVAQALAL